MKDLMGRFQVKDLRARHGLIFWTVLMKTFPDFKQCSKLLYVKKNKYMMIYILKASFVSLFTSVNYFSYSPLNIG